MIYQIHSADKWWIYWLGHPNVSWTWLICLRRGHAVDSVHRHDIWNALRYFRHPCGNVLSNTKSIGDSYSFGLTNHYGVLKNISDGTRCLCLRHCTVPFDNVMAKVQFSCSDIRVYLENQLFRPHWTVD